MYDDDDDRTWVLSMPWDSRLKYRRRRPIRIGSAEAFENLLRTLRGLVGDGDVVMVVNDPDAPGTALTTDLDKVIGTLPARPYRVVFTARTDAGRYLFTVVLTWEETSIETDLPVPSPGLLRSTRRAIDNDAKSIWLRSRLSSVLRWRSIRPIVISAERREASKERRLKWATVALSAAVTLIINVVARLLASPGGQ